MTQKNAWIKSGDSYTIADAGAVTHNIELGIYRYFQTPSGAEGLTRLEDGDSFDAPDTAIDVNGQAVQHIAKRIKGTSASFGALFSGRRGTGKSYAMKRLGNIALAEGMIVIVIDKYWPDIAAFISRVRQPMMIMFDEFEKVYKKTEGQQVKLLSLFDGLSDGSCRRIFLLSSNSADEHYIDENFFNRPSRIRYHVKFKGLPRAQIINLVEGRLKYPEFKDDVLVYIEEKGARSIDMIMEVIDEVNLFRCSPKEFGGFFNIENEALPIIEASFYDLETDEFLFKQQPFRVNEDMCYTVLTEPSEWPEHFADDGILISGAGRTLLRDKRFVLTGYVHADDPYYTGVPYIGWADSAYHDLPYDTGRRACLGEMTEKAEEAIKKSDQPTIEKFWRSSSFNGRSCYGGDPLQCRIRLKIYSSFPR